jgi:hypothetical protein
MTFTDRMHHSNPKRAERELDDDQSPHPFPFEYVRSKLVTSISNLNLNANQNYATTPNTVLVWAGARTVSLPLWIYCDEKRIRGFMNKYLDRLQVISGQFRTLPSPLSNVRSVIGPAKWVNRDPSRAWTISTVGSGAPLYGERYSESLLSLQHFENFRLLSDKRVSLWSSTLENLGLEYCVYRKYNYTDRDIK